MPPEGAEEAGDEVEKTEPEEKREVEEEKAEEEFGVTIRQTEEVGMRKDVAYIVIDRCFGSGNF